MGSPPPWLSFWPVTLPQKKSTRREEKIPMSECDVVAGLLDAGQERNVGLVKMLPPPPSSEDPQRDGHVVVVQDTSTISTTNPYHSFRSNRSASGSSMTFLPPGPIALIDHTVEASDRTPGIFARNVYIGDYTVVSGSLTKAGAYVVYNCSLETLEGNKMTLRKRYSEFDRLRERLVQAFPRSEAALPALPPKSVVSKFRPKFLETRRQGLNYFLSCILMNPEFSGSPLVKQFLFSRDWKSFRFVSQNPGVIGAVHYTTNYDLFFLLTCSTRRFRIDQFWRFVMMIQILKWVCPSKCDSMALLVSRLDPSTCSYE